MAKVQLQRLSGKSLCGSDRASFGGTKCRKRGPLAPFLRLVVPRNGAYSEFPDSLYTLDFSHLNQTGLCRSPPIPFKAGVVSRRLGTPSVRSRRPSSPSGPNRLIRTFWSPAARVRQLLLWHCVWSSSGAHERGQFRPVKASGTFCVWSPTPTRKKSYGHPGKAKRCALPCSQMAKVEREETVWK